MDADVVSRFATCCRALGIAVYDRKRPADLDAARSGFGALTRVASDQCDAWTGLAAAGDQSIGVLEAVLRTAGTAGTLQRHVELAAGSLGFLYDTGLYLRFRATDPDGFHLAYAAALALAGESAQFAKANELVSGIVDRRPSWRDARWLAVVINYRAQRWSDVVKLLTPIVNDSELDEAFAHAAKITLGTALARLGMFARRCPTSRNRTAPFRSPRSMAHWPRRWCCVPTWTRSRQAKSCRTCMPPIRRTSKSSTRSPTPALGL
ncbi:ESX-3 secretion system EccA3 domain protein [Mycobacterium ulcerans str. Harvey]|uniref:ESX-3 secretion system EccA3 domain protein n=1 Tax=Mycobacterium ulcerans str. Harvey TaxID=1299332 RepID=A0ABN0R3I1_MYCUL|nr:ESX-3 secretion system EccA3 domain protein [Mycobacterium ulcerans str. Harvey]